MATSLEQSASEQNWFRRAGARLWTTLTEGPAAGRPSWSVLVVAAVLLVGGGWLLAPRHSTGLAHTSVLGVLFDSRWVIGVIRLTGAVATYFVLASIIARALSGQWLKRLGPADVDDPVSAVSEDGEVLQEALDRADDTIQDLQEQLARAIAVIESISHDEHASGYGGNRPGEPGAARTEDRHDS